MQSETCAHRPRSCKTPSASILEVAGLPWERLSLLLLFLAVALLGACEAPDAKVESKGMTFGETIQAMGLRMSAVHDHRKGILELPFFRSTTVLEEIQSMSYRIDVTTRNIVALNDYNEEAIKQGLPEVDRFKFKAKEIASIEDLLDHYERVFLAFKIERESNGELFFDLYGKTVHANQVLTLFIENGVSCGREQTLMRDYSARVKDCRNYWCQELTNILRGLEPDPDIMALAVGSARGLAPELNKEHVLINRAASDFHRLMRSHEGLKSRLKWSVETVERLPNDDPWRKATEPELQVLAEEVAAIAEPTAAAMKAVTEPGDEAQKARDQIVEDLAHLLNQLNQLVVVEAQKRGWPLPQ